MAVLSFGKVTVPSGGSPVSAAANVLSQLAAGEPVLLQSVLIQAHFSNTGKVYVFTAMPAGGVDRRVSLVGALGVLPAPFDPTDGPFPSISLGVPLQAVTMNLAQVWIDVDVDGDSVIVSGTVG